MGGIRPLQLTLRERNVGLIHGCRRGPSTDWEPVKHAVPFLQVPGIMDEVVLVRLEQSPKGMYSSFPFERLSAPSAAQLRTQINAQTACQDRGPSATCVCCSRQQQLPRLRANFAGAYNSFTNNYWICSQSAKVGGAAAAQVGQRRRSWRPGRFLGPPRQRRGGPQRCGTPRAPRNGSSLEGQGGRRRSGGSDSTTACSVGASSPTTAPGLGLGRVCKRRGFRG